MKLPWLEEDDVFPPAASAWDEHMPAPGLLAAGGNLSVERLRSAYAAGIFPWYSDEQPILWWSPDPRMVLHVAQFRVHRSLRQTLQKFRQTPGCEIRIDHDFASVIRACSGASRSGQSGTWIVPDMVEAYIALHHAGTAHSVETWIDGQCTGGLYCIAIGQAVFGESMFSRQSGASKIALAALVALCRRGGAQQIDCQQNTAHLASLGAREIPRAQFVVQVEAARAQPPMEWHFEPPYWNELLTSASAPV